MNISTEQQGKVTVVSLEGEVDMYSSPELREKIQGFLKNKGQQLCFDFTKVKYIDSSGIATLVEAFQKLNKVKGEMRLAAIPSRLFSVFEISKLDRVFQIDSDVSTALKGFS